MQRSQNFSNSRGGFQGGRDGGYQNRRDQGENGEFGRRGRGDSRGNKNYKLFVFFILFLSIQVTFLVIVVGFEIVVMMNCD